MGHFYKLSNFYNGFVLLIVVKLVVGSFFTVIKNDFLMIPKKFNIVDKHIDKKINMATHLTIDKFDFMPSLKIENTKIKGLSKDTLQISSPMKETLKITDTPTDISQIASMEEEYNPNYIKPLKTEFSSYVSVQNYAKNRVVQALNTDSPYEHLVFIDKKTNKVIAEYKGNEEQVSLGGIGYIKTSGHTSQVHGHPTMLQKDGKPVTAPVSLPDFIGINHKGEEVFAYNANGEYSVLRKKAGFMELTNYEIDAYDKKYTSFLDSKFVEKKKSQFPSEFAGIKTLEDFEKRCSELSESLEGKTRKNEIEEELSRLYKDFNSSFDIIESVHEFWKKYADELGLIYRTNYSFLK